MDARHRHRRPLLLRFSLRANLLILMGIVAAVLVADRAHEIISDRSARIADAHAEIRALAERGERRQADVIADVRAILGLASSLAFADGRPGAECQAPFRRIVAERPFLVSLSVMTRDGRQVCTSADRPLLQSVGDRPYFRTALATRAFVVSDYIVSRRTGKPVVIAALPRIVGGEAQSVVTASVDFRWISRLAGDDRAAGGASIALLDGNGAVLAAFPETGVGSRLTMDSKFWEEMKSRDGVTDTAAIGGVKRIVGHVRLSDTQAVLVVSRKRSDVLAGANQAARTAIAKIAAFGLLCAFGIWLGGEFLVLRPVEALTRGAARLGAGDLTARVEPDGLSPELRLLAETFNAMGAQLAGHEMDLQRANRLLSKLALTDGLTGLANRRSFDEQSAAEWRRALRAGSFVSLVMIDVDFFKKFNDRYGHIAGDECLKRVAHVLRKAGRRPGDVAARTGGEEFAILLSAGIGDATAIAEAIRRAVEELAIEHVDSREGRVTVSVGVAAFAPRPGEDVRLLLNAADAALYRAKTAGRNRMISAGPPVALAS